MQSPRELVGIEDVQRPAEIEGQVVGDVDQRRDRPQTHRDQPLLQPLRARPVAHAADQPADEVRAGAAVSASKSKRTPIGLGNAPAPASRRAASARPSPAAARSRAMPRTPRQSPRFGVIAMSITGSSSPSAGGGRRTDGGVRRQFDDAGVLVRQPHLAFGEQHAVAVDAADRRRLQRHAGAGDDRCRPAAKTPFMPGAGVRCAADDLQRARRRYRRCRRAAYRRSGAAAPRSPRRRRNRCSAAPRSSIALDLEADHRQPRRRSPPSAASVSRCSFSQDSVNFIAVSPAYQRRHVERGKAVVAQPAQVGFEEACAGRECRTSAWRSAPAPCRRRSPDSGRDRCRSWRAPPG